MTEDTPKLCKDCVFVERRRKWWRFGPMVVAAHPYCFHSSSRVALETDFVTGELKGGDFQFASTSRLSLMSDRCGERGKYFKPVGNGAKTR